MDFNATIHDLRAALNALLGNAQLLAGEHLTARARRRTAVIESQARRMITLIEGLVSEDGGQVARGDVVLEKLIRGVMDELEAIFEGNGVDVTFASESVLPRVCGDRDALHRVFLNMLKNAADAMPAGGTIAVRAKVSPLGMGGAPMAWIEVTDTGLGIPTNLIAKIFDPGVTTKGTPGSGLGLAICREIVEAHGGNIEVQSGVGSGTTFRLTLPVAFQPRVAVST